MPHGLLCGVYFVIMRCITYKVVIRSLNYVLSPNSPRRKIMSVLSGRMPDGEHVRSDRPAG